MPTQTFNPGTTVPPTGVIGSSAHITDDSLGTDITPAGWPTSGNATAVEIELTATSTLPADGNVQTGVSADGSLDPITGFVSDAGGTWSGWDGTLARFRTGNTDAWYWNKFGGWRTDYLTFSASGATDNRVVSTSTQTPTGGFDIRAKVRATDWDGLSGARLICSSGLALGVFYNGFWLQDDTVYFQTRDASVPYMGPIFSVPMASFTLVDGAWTWLRCSYAGSGNDAYMWQSADGTSWTLVATKTTPGWSSDLATTMHLGASNHKNGMNGDLAEFVAYDAGGALIHDLNLSSMTSNVDRDWSSAVSNIHDNVTVSARAYGAAIPGTKRVRLDLESPVAMDDWRLIIDAQVGEVTVDEILLEWADAASRQIGLGRGVRGLG